jgi:hypothetical protein
MLAHFSILPEAVVAMVLLKSEKMVGGTFSPPPNLPFQQPEARP